LRSSGHGCSIVGRHTPSPTPSRPQANRKVSPRLSLGGGSIESVKTKTGSLVPWRRRRGTYYTKQEDRCTEHASLRGV
jgi:hypothetical protein